MLAKVHSGAVYGVDAYTVEVEVNVGHGEPRTFMVGLPDAAVKESEYRVKTALINSDFGVPMGTTTINLAPADIKKEGALFDLPIAIGMIAGDRQIDDSLLERACLVGELALSGAVRKVRGVLPIAVQAKNAGFKAILVPLENAPEAAVVEGLKVFGIESLRQAADFLDGKLSLTPHSLDLDAVFNDAAQYPIDFAEVKGQEFAKRAIEIGVAGGHNLLLIGPPGTGKSMISKRIPSILPPMSLTESLETTKIHSIAGRLKPNQALIATRPFRAPHHTISDVGLLGGGTHPSPGEVSMAHNGVLFLDEFPEFQRSVLEVMRQPLEDGEVTIARSAATSTFPSRFMLVASMNPCPCGYAGDPRRECRCTSQQITRYRNRISGPLLDRIDIHIEVPSLAYNQLAGLEKGESSADIRKRIIRARTVQQMRYAASEQIHCNSDMGAKEVQAHCQLTDSAAQILKIAMMEYNFSARAYDRILKVGRTIADLAESAEIEEFHIQEAVQLRMLDRQLWV